METDLSIINLVMESSWIEKGVLLVLLLISVASWAVIIEKQRLLKQATRAANEFENTFWSGGDLTSLYREITSSDSQALGMAGIFEAGFREFGRLKQEVGLSPDHMVEGARRSMHVSQLREVDRLEHHLAFLATVGSTSPYIGLFGTVWGIMSSFQALAGVQSATIAAVAPGIAQALIATAMGLFAAIPAVIAFNRFADGVGRLEVRYDTFMEELTAIFQRSAARLEAAAAGGAR